MFSLSDALVVVAQLMMTMMEHDFHICCFHPSYMTLFLLTIANHFVQKACSLGVSTNTFTQETGMVFSPLSS